MKKKPSKKLSRSRGEVVQVARFVYETGIHRHTPRSGFWFLGSGEQSIAEHSFRAAFIAYALAHLAKEPDPHRAVLMALAHDLGEGRTGDLNYVHQRYGRLSEKGAFEDLAKTIPFGKELLDLYNEEQGRSTSMAKLVKDADSLEWIASLREEETKGNLKAAQWARDAVRRLKTPEGKRVGKALFAMHPDAWWHDPTDPWFVGRKEKDRKWKDGTHKRK
ncbi:MAG: HD domain-containing protein [bacterium]|nr:HD domain-containing protein [bacterium]